MAQGGSDELSSEQFEPNCVIVFSGKRKSGKDHITNILQERLKNSDAVVIRLSAPIKSQWAEKQNLDFSKLLGTGEYKENHRLEMIRWSESLRAKDPGYFCRLAVKMSGASAHRVWIVSDARRISDIKWFMDNCGGPSKVHTVRIVASDEVRKQRGWKFTPGVDDAESECGLDSFVDWNWTVSNNEDGTESLESNLQEIVKWVNFKCTRA